MKHFFLIIIFLLTIQSAFSQIDKPISESKTQTVSINPIYFVLGTLSDYNGRFYYVKREKQVDRYYPFEKPIVNYLTLYIKTELDINVDTIFEKSNHSEMYSEKLSKKMNSFYGEKDELLNGKFETNEQIYSFLAGVYYRYGDKLDVSIYKIQLANSPKHQNCHEFLKQIGCKNILYERLKNIPAQFIYYFEPTDELKKYFDSIDSERILLEKSFHNSIVEMMTNSITKEELEMSLQKSKEEDLEKFKNTTSYDTKKQTISGIITNDTNKAIPGANVFVKGIKDVVANGPLVVKNGKATNAQYKSVQEAKKHIPKQLDDEELESLIILKEPLYIINGVYYSEESLFETQPTNPYIPLNKQNIKTLEILQDEEAIEKFGEKGSKGVVIITTKNGVPNQK